MANRGNSGIEAVYQAFSSGLSLDRQALTMRRYCCGTLWAASLYEVQVTMLRRVQPGFCQLRAAARRHIGLSRAG